MYTIAESILKKNNLPFHLLKPLIEETVHKIKSASPHNVQTGPAIRNDKTVIKKHLALLRKNKSYQNIYKLISKSIIKNKK